MNFNSFIFLLVFLPAVLIIYWRLRKRGHYSASLWFLTLASVFFYGYEYPRGLLVLALSLLVNFLFLKGILAKPQKKIILGLGLGFDLVLLAFFKYGSLLWSTLPQDLLTAPGISFYTFCEIALLMECYRGTIGTISSREYAFLLTFFPKMMQGPILRPMELLDQKEGAHGVSWENIYRGIFLFTLGLFKKVILANTLGGAVDYGYGHLEALHTGEALVVMLSYSLQLYFDFSGYCDMAMALATFFGFELPLNFNSPYKAINIFDFWKRWHISLTKFFTRYLYIPLGGNRRGRFRTYINFLIIFLVSGLWHGAGLNFIIWGLMHGIMYVIVRALQNLKEVKAGRKAGEKTGGPSVNISGEKSGQNSNGENSFLGRRAGWRKIGGSLIKGIKIFGTFLYVSVAWVFFRAPSTDDALHLFKDMGQLWFPRFNTDLAKCFNIDELWYVIKILHLDSLSWGIYILPILILSGLTLMVFAGKNAVEVAQKSRINLLNTLFIAILLIWSMLSFEGVTTYIYVNF